MGIDHKWPQDEGMRFEDLPIEKRYNMLLAENKRLIGLNEALTLENNSYFDEIKVLNKRINEQTDEGVKQLKSNVAGLQRKVTACLLTIRELTNSSPMDSERSKLVVRLARRKQAYQRFKENVVIFIEQHNLKSEWVQFMYESKEPNPIEDDA